MISSFARRLFGDSNSREIKKLKAQVTAINTLEPEFKKKSDDALKEMTASFKNRLQAGEAAQDILVEAFATVREAALRTLGQRHFDVQLMGGLILHSGEIAEMKTGEGKTLVATLSVYLNALCGRGVHVVTVNDYLASRDAQWMGQIYEFLGLSVGCITAGLDDAGRRAAYGCDVTYGTNNEFGFDYLRDNLKFTLDDMVQREHHYAIVDEVDSILIDEARTPLIISGPAETSVDIYNAVDQLIGKLDPSDYELDEKSRSVTFTETGIQHAEDILTEAQLITQGGLYDIANVSLLHHMTQALRAHKLFQSDTHYMNRGGQVIIIDEFTGRAMEGRRYSDGLHQAIEAKEKVAIQSENQTLASVTYQNYFRLYEKLAGMTGTALTEAGEFSEIYKLEVTSVPTNQPVKRKDFDDEVYRTSKERDDAVITLIKDCQKRGQPILVGTVSIEKSESLSAALTAGNINHQVLNARFHEEEAKIIALAGAPEAVTIATNMAGRGTDIQLGGNYDMLILLEAVDDEGQVDAQKAAAIRAEIEQLKIKALDAGGLYVVGTERHESRRIDNQLRGRTGRQGDPGASKFFLSLEDDLMRIFGSERLDGMLQKLGLEPGEAITHPWINKAVEKAQSKVEAHNFEIRKQLLRYDDVMNDQRQVIFAQRREIMQISNVNDTVRDMRYDTIEQIVSDAIPAGSYADQWDSEKLKTSSQSVLGLVVPAEEWIAEDGIADEEIIERLQQKSDSYMAEKAARFGPELMRMAEKSLLLQVLDQQWKEHLLQLEQLRQGINLRAYAQKDPLNEYKKEAFLMFDTMLTDMRQTVTLALSHVEVSPQPTEPDPIFAPGKVARNAPCPCGSGRKYKYCHGKL